MQQPLPRLQLVMPPAFVRRCWWAGTHVVLVIAGDQSSPLATHRPSGSRQVPLAGATPTGSGCRHPTVAPAPLQHVGLCWLVFGGAAASLTAVHGPFPLPWGGSCPHVSFDAHSDPFDVAALLGALGFRWTSVQARCVGFRKPRPQDPAAYRSHRSPLPLCLTPPNLRRFLPSLGLPSAEVHLRLVRDVIALLALVMAAARLPLRRPRAANLRAASPNPSPRPRPASFAYLRFLRGVVQ